MKHDIKICLRENIITQEEADSLRAWLKSINPLIDNEVPEELYPIVARMYLYLDPAEGGLQ